MLDLIYEMKNYINIITIAQHSDGESAIRSLI